ncbi:MAG TPA: hypothetical protein DCQ16_06185 [Spirochaetaceae bacterium]|nr:hypothetical protein [Spirochaetaceae bacterium]
MNLLGQVLDHVYGPACFGLIRRELILFIALNLIKIDDRQALFLYEITVSLADSYPCQPRIEAGGLVIINHIAEPIQVIGQKHLLFLAQPPARAGRTRAGPALGRRALGLDDLGCPALGAGASLGGRRLPWGGGELRRRAALDYRLRPIAFRVHLLHGGPGRAGDHRQNEQQ